MAQLPKRIFALSLAILFFVTTVGFTGLVIWQIQQENEQAKIDEGLQQALQQQQTQQQPENQINQEEGALKGTKLQNFAPVSSVNQLQTVDIKEGTGEEVAAGATVTAHYTGALAKDGTIFESSKDGGQPATFPLAQVIAGWQQGVPGMKVGGTRRLIIPASLAYGEAGSPPTIGPNEPLVFDIELISIGE